MSMRVRLTLWYGGLLVVCILLAVWPSYQELIVESEEHPVSRPEAWREFHDIAGDMALFCLPPIAVGLFIGWWMTKRAMRPLDDIISAAQRINEDTLHERLPCGGDMEIRRLAEVFNSMFTRLEASFARVRDFTLHASHELKTPLAILHCGLENQLVDWQNLSDEQRQILGSQLEEISRLARLVDDLGTLTKADAGQMPLCFEELNFGELVEEMADNAEHLATANSLQVSIGPCKPLLVLGDRHRLRQSLLILVDNAVKHNCAGGRISIELKSDEHQSILSITNTGPGLAHELGGRVFDRFFRGPDAGGNIEGCGLGLSISHWIVDAHGGSLEFQSSEGGLTTVRMLLPLASKNGRAA